MFFTLTAQDSQSRARTGVLELVHGCVETPAFMPVGTNATVKAMPNEYLEELDFRLILGNAYHLYLRPGSQVIRNCGGLHSFMGWSCNILTDSGGYQIFSLACLRKIEEEGVTFRSHLDGSTHHLTPEDVVDFQELLGSDILMPLDVCTPVGITEEQARDALELTLRWAKRSKDRWINGTREPSGQLFGIVQGNFYKDLRARSAAQTIELALPGYAIGGLSVGEPFSMFQELLSITAGLLPAQSPRYLMGVGTPEYILEAVDSGIDLFDCVFPTRTARNAQAFSRMGPLSLKNESNILSLEPIDSQCSCKTCARYSRSYLRHLFKTKEILASVLTTYHNLYFIHDLMRSIREAIRQNRFVQFKWEFLRSYQKQVQKARRDAEQ